jgi:hypothetical protein
MAEQKTQVVPANTEEEADAKRDGVITGDKTGENIKTPEKELPLPKLGDNPRTRVNN